ncbi:MAG: M64 family metallopeptidase, partial [Bacteroidetes bacterium]|nr:M64 family metallopeptidase [Bacteroidota bacterium]
NVDINDQPTQIRWAHFLQSPYLEKYPHLGIYEGGFGYALGVYHPDQNNVMLLHGNLSYDEPSQEAIIKRIYQIHEWPYTLEVFQSYF